MYIIAIAWLYVAILASVTSTSALGGVLTFLFLGLGPLALYLWLFGTPARRRAAARRQAEAANDNDRADSGANQ
jgi:hypothetical protein